MHFTNCTSAVSFCPPTAPEWFHGRAERNSRRPTVLHSDYDQNTGLTAVIQAFIEQKAENRVLLM